MKYSLEFIDYLKSIGTLRLNEPLSIYTSFKCGGPADILFYPDGIESIPKLLIAAKEANVPVTAIGWGSNLLAGDRGVRGIVLRICHDSVSSSMIRHENDLIYTDASVMKEDFIDFSMEAGYEGYEFMAGIPGSIGGGIMMNAGTNMGNFIDILESVDMVNGSGNIRNIKTGRDMTAYRKFKIEENAVITGGYFRLRKLKNKTGTKKLIMNILDERKSKHPLNYPSAGSVFKNPEGFSSWKLINDSGLKGARIGGAMVSELHTNFIINYNNAKSSDVRSLIEKIQEEVFRKFQVILEPEIRMIGEF